MNFANVNIDEVIGYISHMRFLHPKHIALWFPTPLDGKEVEIGDVGYIYKGAFRRLFNATVDAFDDMNEDRAPDGHKPIPFQPDTDVVTVEKCEVIEQDIPCCSSNKVTVGYTQRESNECVYKLFVALILSEVRYLSFDLTKKGSGNAYVLISPAPVEERVLHPSKHDLWKRYFEQNYKDWLKFGEKLLGRPMKAEELIFVRGWVKSSKWVIATLSEKATYHLDIDMSHTIKATLTLRGQELPDSVRCGTDLSEAYARVRLEQFGDAGEDGRANPRTRCLFFCGFRMEREFFVRKIVASAEPRSPPRKGPEEADGHVLTSTNDEDDRSEVNVRCTYVLRRLVH